MKRVVTLLHTVAKSNPHPDFRTVFMDPNHRVAIAGYRRRYDLGDCLARVTSEHHEDFDISQQPGCLDFMDSKYRESHGLIGQTMPDGTREIVDAAKCEEKFQSVLRAMGPDPFKVLLNPIQISKWIDQTLRKNGKTSMENLKISMHVMHSMTQEGIFPAIIHRDEVGRFFVLWKTKRGEETCWVDEQQTLMPLQNIQIGKFHWVQPARIENGWRFVSVLEPMMQHVRFAIQELRQGFMSPDDHIRYSVWDRPRDSKIIRDGIGVFPFITTETMRNIPDQMLGNYYLERYPVGQPPMKRNPVMTFDLDTFKRGLSVVNPAPVAELRFKDSLNGVYLKGEAPHAGLTCEVIMGPTIPERNGRVCTE